MTHHGRRNDDLEFAQWDRMTLAQSVEERPLFERTGAFPLRDTDYRRQIFSHQDFPLLSSMESLPEVPILARILLISQPVSEASF